MQQGFPMDGLQHDRGTVVLLILNILTTIVLIVGLYRVSIPPARYRDLLWWITPIVPFLLCFMIASVLPGLLMPTFVDRFLSIRIVVIDYFVFHCFFAFYGLTELINRLRQPGKEHSPIYLMNALVTGIIGVGLIEFMAPNGHSPEVNRRTQCKNKLKQIGLALHNYHDAHDVFPPSSTGAPGTPDVSWRVQLLPYLNLQSLYDRYDQTRSWNAHPNSELAKRSPDVFQCPSNWHNKTERAFTDYAMLTDAARLEAVRKDSISMTSRMERSRRLQLSKRAA